ncbi:unnamed protein product [Schistosoma rodhaini]|uniref:Uncharacterized protein n=1 Tax=Schistosoma rodhaini TaxID=6188 RepID=A0AA85ESD3_9TREM|nr:unnamed protein product [Schistosoma rodhaini]
MDVQTCETFGFSHTTISQNAISLLKNIYVTVNSGNIQSITESEVNNIKSLINDLRSLHKMRCCAHQILETESIKTSALRVKLQEFKKQKIEEIFDKRNLVKMLNEKELKNLGDSLNSIKSNYEESEQALEKLTRILKLLRLHELKSNEENSVTLEALNNCLDNKANKQIFLNQKMEEIEMTELKVKETEKMLDDLNAEITEERRNAVRKVIMLEEEARKLEKALNVQNEKNKTLEIPHQELNELLRNKRFEEYSLSNNVDELHNNIHEYKIRKSALLNTIQKKEIEIKTAEEKRDFIQQSLNKMLEEHEESLENIRKELKKIEESQETSITNIEAYEKKKEILKADEQRYESDKDKLQKVFKKKETEVIQVEKEYMMKAEKTAELQDQINEMLEKMDNLNVSNKSIIDNLKQQAEMINGQLANARKERVQLQRKQRKIHKQVNSFNDEQNLFIRKYQRRINETKSKINLIYKQKTQLEKEIEINKQKFGEIQSTMKVEKEHHDNERIHTTEKIVSLNKLLDEFVEKCQQMDKNIQDDLPKLEGLNNKVKKIEMIETETKSFQVEMNQNIRSLENEIKRLNDENKKLDFDLKLSKKQTNTFELDYMKKLMNQIDSLNINEKNIYTYGCRLKTVEIENSRINTGITKQEQSIQTICSDWEKILRFKSIFNNQYQSITDMIINNENIEKKLIQSSIDLYNYFINIKLKLINNQCIERNQLLNQFLSELMIQYNEMKQFFTISSPPPSKKKEWRNKKNNKNT